MKDRITMGFAEDVARSEALTRVDPAAEANIYAAADWEHERKSSGGKIASALRRLSARDKRFAQKVLKGFSHDKMGMSKRHFNRELKKVINFLNP